MKGDPVQRFWKYVQKTDGCWNWTGWTHSEGYGYLHVSRKLVRVHRYSYELHKGPIPEGLQVDHLCRNRRCVNPEHLEAVTQKVNILRGESWSAKNARKKTCPYGHPLSGENLSVNSSLGFRICKTCHRVRMYRNYHKKKECLNVQRVQR